MAKKSAKKPSDEETLNRVMQLLRGANIWCSNPGGRFGEDRCGECNSCQLMDLWEEWNRGKEEAEEAARAVPGGAEEVPPDVQEALDVALEIVRVIDEDVPERSKAKALDYFESVRDFAQDVSETITQKNRVTENQRGALDRSLAGVRKWVRND